MIIFREFEFWRNVSQPLVHLIKFCKVFLLAFVIFSSKNSLQGIFVLRERKGGQMEEAVIICRSLDRKEIS